MKNGDADRLVGIWHKRLNDGKGAPLDIKGLAHRQHIGTRYTVLRWDWLPLSDRDADFLIYDLTGMGCPYELVMIGDGGLTDMYTMRNHRGEKLPVVLQPSITVNAFEIQPPQMPQPQQQGWEEGIREP